MECVIGVFIYVLTGMHWHFSYSITDTLLYSTYCYCISCEINLVLFFFNLGRDPLRTTEKNQGSEAKPITTATRMDNHKTKL